MPRIIWVPQFPTSMRYQEFWFSEIPKQLSKEFEVITLGETYDFPKTTSVNNEVDWTPIQKSLNFELYQIYQYQSLKLLPDDILFVADLSFQSTFCSQLYFKRPKKCYAYCHGTCKNKFDLFENDRSSKWMVETGHSKLFDIVFVGSQYHKNKLGWNNIEVIGLPRNPKVINMNLYSNKIRKRLYFIISVARPCIQKITKKDENKIIEKMQIKINRKMCSEWDEYSEFLSTSRVLLISSKEDTFNYTILDALQCGCIPVAPNRLCFPEILPNFLLYNNPDEAVEIISNILNNEVQIDDVKLKNEYLVSNFYKNLIKIFKG